MKTYKQMVCIVGQTLEEAYLRSFRENGVDTVFTTPCHGTASRTVRAYLGIDNDGYVKIQAIMSTEKSNELLMYFVTRLGIGLPGGGIAMTLPIRAFAGKPSMLYLLDGQTENDTEEEWIMKKNAFELITVIAEKGYSDKVMDAARSKGARGGTVTHAKGTAGGFTMKYFGVSIAAEKEIIEIVARAEDAPQIMQAIMEQAGPASEARAAVFSQPVEAVVGLRTS